MTGSVITPQLRELLNKPGERQVVDVEKGRVKFFADAIDDDNPIYTDPEYAATTRFREVIVPPLFLIDNGIAPHVDVVTRFNPLTALINGGTEIEYFVPIKVGDTITAIPMVTDLQEKDGRSGKMIFVTVQAEYHNQHEELVCRVKNTFIFR